MTVTVSYSQMCDTCHVATIYRLLLPLVTEKGYAKTCAPSLTLELNLQL